MITRKHILTLMKEGYSMIDLLTKKRHAKSTHPVKILQFGTGNFLRAFIEPIVQELNKVADFNGSIVIAQSTAGSTAQKINEQDGLYTLITQGIENNELINQSDIIDVISEVVSMVSNYDDYMKISQNEDLQLIISNTTESGISYKNEPSFTHHVPVSFPARLTHFLYERYRYFNGNLEKGLTILPCELIEKNGARLKEIILQHAKDWDLEEDFTKWLHEANIFYDTLVDRIVPGFPKDEYETLQLKWGYADSLAVKCEPYLLWAIEGDEMLFNTLPLNKLSWNIKVVSDIQPYRLQKVRVLNGLHTVMAITGLLADIRTVAGAVEDERFYSFLQLLVRDEIDRATQIEGINLLEYSQEIFERFKNPYVEHYLENIMLNSFSKFKVRVLPVWKDYQKLYNDYPIGLTFAWAALLYCYSGIPKITLNDEIPVIQKLMRYGEMFADEPLAFVEIILQDLELWEESVYTPGLAQLMTKNIEMIHKHGIRKALEEVMK